MTSGTALTHAALDRRFIGFRIGATAVFLTLLFSFWQIQVRDAAYYRDQAVRNRIKTLPIPAARGRLLDRHGRVMVASSLTMSALIDLASARPENLPKIAAGLGLEVDRVRRLLQDASEYGGSTHIQLKENLSVEAVSFLQAHRGELREIDVIESMHRQYPDTGVAVHAVGYVGEASKTDLNEREFLFRDYGAKIGKSGIERQYDDWLVGQDGNLNFLVDSLGRQLEVLGLEEPIPGNDLQLTIDLDLQAVSELGLEGRKGAVVALDPRNGEILAMASAPAFDPNKFVTGFFGGEWQALNEDGDTPMLNRAIQGQWAPGSVIKPIYGLAGLQANLAGDDFRVRCRGGLPFGGRLFRCHKRGGHGTVALHDAIAKSCDVYFYQLGLKLGVDTIARYARLAGLGGKTFVDLPQELAGFVPTVRWKVRELLQPWYPGETLPVAIGQGAMTATPLQMAHSVGGLAMGGVWHQPRLIADTQLATVRPGAPARPPRETAIDPAHHAILLDAMSAVVNGAGTGRQARLSDIEVCGKTGTSQRVSNELRLRAKRKDYEDDAWFVGFAPCRAPEIVAAVLIENGKASYYAAALARDVIQAWLLGRQPGRETGEGKLLAQALGEEE